MRLIFHIGIFTLPITLEPRLKERVIISNYFTLAKLINWLNYNHNARLIMTTKNMILSDIVKN